MCNTWDTPHSIQQNGEAVSNNTNIAQLQPVTKKLCNSDWLVLYPRGLRGKYVEIISWYIFVFTHVQFCTAAKFVYMSKLKRNKDTK